MHAIEKILAKKAGLATVQTGDVVNCEVDTAGINDLYLQTVRSFYEVGAEQRSIALTVSVGVTVCAGSESAGTALQRADEAMYLAKERGRNRVEMTVAAAAPLAPITTTNQPAARTTLAA